ncbi:YigZ family protein [Thalassotalea ponticola]|uniref:YigZ family protein n=1 Tax=Thalassotalea ponticola TaxID=1523392 RepID=UPI0025B503D8|nr:YigZ family protein [Thalassotalea ponticola]MDN3653054.1 YigZ family protein [Thalassotalea ponticola]
MTPFRVPAAGVEVEIDVNKSRFICAISQCQSPAEAKAFIAQITERYPDASHHCYAFIYSRPEHSTSYGFSDDGEPSGTAGRPMLAVLQGSQIGEICAVVTRYFGGVKLGTGGLQRAYGASVRQALDSLTTRLKVPVTPLEMRCAYDQLNTVEHVIAQFQGEIVEQQFNQDVFMSVNIASNQIDQFCQRIFEASSGRIDPIKP